MSFEANLLKAYNLKKHTSWLVGGEAEYAFFPKSKNDLEQAILWAYKNNLEITVLGSGSNVLISDKGVKGLVILMEKMCGFTISEKNNKFYLDAWAGTLKSDVLKFFIKEKLAPAVFLAGLPGDLGGGVVMNAGVSTNVEPREFVSITEEIEVFKFNKIKNQVDSQVFKNKDLKWSYRKSEGWQPGIIFRVQLSWPKVIDENVFEKVKEGNVRRKNTQPLTQPSCGSVFKNPETDKAGRLIEAAGLKGFRIGDAQVSEKHANFIVNLGDATAADIDRLIKHIQKTVGDRFGIILTNEVKYLGLW